MNTSGDWILGGQGGPDEECELFCLPHAGGSSLAYRDWAEWAPSWLGIHPVELPGRGRRFREPPHRRMHTVAGAVASAISVRGGRPYALFGHSMGALVAFEVVRVLRARGHVLPHHLFVSAMAAPGRTPRSREFLHTATDEALVERLRSYNGTPPEVLASAELLDLVLPTIRADFELLETYRLRAEPPLGVPVTVFGGREDALVGPAELLAWRDHAPLVGVRVFDGDHFYLSAHGATVVDAISTALADASVGVR